jgi:hypothetical protein
MKKIGLFALLMTGLLGQAQAGTWNNDAVLGGALGGATGAAVGSAVGGRDGAIIGGLLGGAVGVAVTSSRAYPHQQVVVERRYVPARQVYYYPAPPRGHAYGYRAHNYGHPGHRPHYGY